MIAFTLFQAVYCGIVYGKHEELPPNGLQNSTLHDHMVIIIPD